MLTPSATTNQENANTAPNALLASTTPGYTGGMVAAEQAGGGDSSRGESRARTGTRPSLIDRMTAEAQAARDQFEFGTVAMGGKTYRMREDWVAVMDRAAAKFGTPTQPARQARGVSR